MRQPHSLLMTPRTAAALQAAGIGPHEGYIGVFCTTNAVGAIPAGSRIVKVREDVAHGQSSTDEHPVGSHGTVLGSIAAGALGTMYFIEWDASPKIAYSVIAWKIGRA